MPARAKVSSKYCRWWWCAEDQTFPSCSILSWQSISWFWRSDFSSVRRFRRCLSTSCCSRFQLINNVKKKRFFKLNEFVQYVVYNLEDVLTSEQWIWFVWATPQQRFLYSSDLKYDGEYLSEIDLCFKEEDLGVLVPPIKLQLWERRSQYKHSGHLYCSVFHKLTVLSINLWPATLLSHLWHNNEHPVILPEDTQMQIHFNHITQPSCAQCGLCLCVKVS